MQDVASTVAAYIEYARELYDSREPDDLRSSLALLVQHCRGLTFDILKHQIASAVLLFQAMDAGEDWVIELRECLCRPLEAFESRGVCRQLGGQRFDGDLAIGAGVLGEVHHAHAATPGLASKFF